MKKYSKVGYVYKCDLSDMLITKFGELKFNYDIVTNKKELIEFYQPAISKKRVEMMKCSCVNEAHPIIKVRVSVEEVK